MVEGSEHDRGETGFIVVTPSAPDVGPVISGVPRGLIPLVDGIGKDRYDV